MRELNAPLRGLPALLHSNGKWGEGGRQAGGRQGQAVVEAFVWSCCPCPGRPALFERCGAPLRTDAEPLPTRPFPVPERGPPRGRRSAPGNQLPVGVWGAELWALATLAVLPPASTTGPERRESAREERREQWRLGTGSGRGVIQTHWDSQAVPCKSSHPEGGRAHLTESG